MRELGGNNLGISGSECHSAKSPPESVLPDHFPSMKRVPWLHIQPADREGGRQTMCLVAGSHGREPSPYRMENENRTGLAV